MVVVAFGVLRTVVVVVVAAATVVDVVDEEDVVVVDPPPPAEIVEKFNVVESDIPANRLSDASLSAPLSISIQ